MENDEYFKNFIKVMNQCHMPLIPFKESSIGTKIAFILTELSLMMDLVGMIVNLIFSYTGAANTRSVRELFVAVVTGVLINYLMLAILVTKEKTPHFFDILANFECFPKPDNFNDLIRDHNLQSKIWRYYIDIGTVLYAVGRVLTINYCRIKNPNDNRTMVCGVIIPMSMPFAIDYFPVNYLIILMQLITLIYAFDIATQVILSQMQVAYHVVARMRHLKKMLTRLDIRGPEVVIKKQLTDYVRWHYEIIRLVGLSNDYLSTIRYCTEIVSLLLATQVVCIAKYKQFHILLLFAPCAFLTFATFWCGQHLSDESESIAFALYDLPWYKMNSTLNKYVIIMMIRAQRPLVIEIGCFSILSTLYLQRISKAAYSFITLMYNAGN